MKLLFVRVVGLLLVPTIANSLRLMGNRASAGRAAISSAAAVSSIMSSSSSTGAAAAAGSVASSAQDAKRGALFGMYVSDAVAMPVHWMYSLDQLRRDYGEIRGYVRPKDRFDGSIMNLSNTGGGGRGSDSGSIIGDVINHGKKKYWTKGGNNHYHLGLQAGENTLEAQLARLLTRTMVANGGVFSPDAFRDAYIEFMRTPGSHNDTYASTAHRQFFANLVRGVDPASCADNDGHNTDAIDALTLCVPVIVQYASAPKEELFRHVKDMVHVTRRTTVVDKYAEAFAELLADVINGKNLRVAVEECGMKYFGSSVARMVESSRGRDPMVACYIDSSFPAMLHFAHKYADSAEAAILASANAGGENVARGSLIGALVGAAHGMSGFPEWAKEGLFAKDAITTEISALVDQCSSTTSTGGVAAASSPASPL